MRKPFIVVTLIVVITLLSCIPISMHAESLKSGNRIDGGSQPIDEEILAQASNGVLFSSYFGGNHSDSGRAIAVDSLGFIYVAGITNSTNFPCTHQIGVGGDYDCYVLKLTPNAKEVVYSTIIGGSDYEVPWDIELDYMGNVVIVGDTFSEDFPMMSPLDSTYDGDDSQDYYGYSAGDSFVFKLNPLGDSLVYSSYLGGSASEHGVCVTIDSEGNAYLAGLTWSSDFPLKNPYDWLLSGSNDIFVTKLSPYGLMRYSSFIGGSGGFEDVSDIDLDDNGNIFVIGRTPASDFPEAYFLADEFGYDDTMNFIFKLSAAGDEIVYSSLFEKEGVFPPNAVIVDSSGQPYIIGYTYDDNFPLVNSMKPIPEDSDSFVMKLSLDGKSIEFSTVYGGTDAEYTRCAVMDSNSNLIVCGTTYSVDFPLVNEVDSSPSGTRSLFVYCINSAGDEILYSTYFGGGDVDSLWDVGVNKYGYAHLLGWTQSTDYPTVNALNDTLRGSIDMFLTILATPDDQDGDHLLDVEEAQHGTSVSNPDSDSDSILDGVEVEFGLDPLSNDANDDEDSDGLTNLQEVLANCNPFISDSDGDSLSDSAEVNIHGSLPYLSDSDYDSLSDDVEVNDVGTDAMRGDTDFDIMPDGFEHLYGLNPFVNDSSDDLDSDGLTNLEELLYGSVPNNPDSDADGIGDSSEVLVYGTNPALADSDGDSLSDYDEIIIYHTNPLSVDTDGDGLQDDWEVEHGFDPAEYTAVTGESTTLAIITLGIAGGLTIPVLLGIEYMIKRGRGLKFRKYRFFIPAIIFLLAIIVFAPPSVQGAGDPGQNAIETELKDFRFVVSPAPFYGDTIRVECSYFMRYYDTTPVTVIFYREGIEEGRVSMTIESTSSFQKTEYARDSLELSPGTYDVIVSVGRTVTTEITQSRVSGVPSEQATWNSMKMGFYVLGGLMVVAAVMIMRRTHDTSDERDSLYYYGQSSRQIINMQ